MAQSNTRIGAPGQNPLSRMDHEPPFQETYKTLLESQMLLPSNNIDSVDKMTLVRERDIPVIDLNSLMLGDSKEMEICKDDIFRASKDWGFFQVINHGISNNLLEKMRHEQIKAFRLPFNEKLRSETFFNFSSWSYRWGTPTATCLRQLSWSEAFHIPMTDIIQSRGFSTFSSIVEEFASKVVELAQELAGILVEKLGQSSNFFSENCLPTTCYLRMNRYPPCPIPMEVYGLVPHTDSDFLTIVDQDQVGGLEILKDEEWVAVKPNPEALIVNIGDLFQAWSNDTYKSAEHRVMISSKVERFSTAYFLCPSHDFVIGSHYKPSVYKEFSFMEYRKQVQEDVENLGFKVGLSRFRNCT